MLFYYLPGIFNINRAMSNLFKEVGLKEVGRFKYLTTSEFPERENIILLHGLMGGLSNFDYVINYFSEDYNVLLPLLPIYELPLHETSLDGLLEYLEAFIVYKNLHDLNLVGNSLGGHIGLIYTLKHQSNVKTLTLTGSSGLFENAMGSTFPKRNNFEYIRQKTAETFYDPAMASPELVDDIFSAVSDRNKALRIILTSKSAIRHNLTDELKEIKIPTLLIWGANDIVTPPFVAEKFNELIPNSQLVWIEKCGHAPMMEHPKLFCDTLNDFLKKHSLVVR